MFMPTIKKVTKTGVETMDLSSYSFQEYRDIYIAEPITDELSVRVITQLKYLDQRGIFIFILTARGDPLQPEWQFTMRSGAAGMMWPPSVWEWLQVWEPFSLRRGQKESVWQRLVQKS